MDISYDSLISKFGVMHTDRIAVIGDIMVDKTVEGTVNRYSPEAPIPIVDVENEIIDIGGAGNVYKNVVSISGDINYIPNLAEPKNYSNISFIGVVGDDGLGGMLIKDYPFTTTSPGDINRFDPGKK